MADDAVALDLADLRAVTSYAVACARPALGLFERAYGDDLRPRGALEAAQAFADGARRTKQIRDAAFAAHRAAQQARTAGRPEAGEAARAAVAAAGAAYLHPLARATQVRHILGAAAHATHAVELALGDESAAEQVLARCAETATPAVVEVLRRFPPAPPGGGRSGELMRRLDATLR